MLQKISARERYHASHGWLQSYHLFSFAEYYDPHNLHFGALPVVNDDTIAGHNGFDAHPHRDMEIVTIVLQGELTHQDSMGNRGVIRAGDVQRMTAGTGVVHAEMNDGDETVRLYQIWIMPRERGLTPSYEQHTYASTRRKNALQVVASMVGDGDALQLNADAQIALGDFDADVAVTHTIEKGRGVFVYVEKGELAINGTVINAGDQARISEEAIVRIAAKSDAFFLLIDVAMES